MSTDYTYEESEDGGGTTWSWTIADPLTDTLEGISKMVEETQKTVDTVSVEVAVMLDMARVMKECGDEFAKAAGQFAPLAEELENTGVELELVEARTKFAQRTKRMKYAVMLTLLLSLGAALAAYILFVTGLG